MDISVIIINWHSAAFVDKCLKSVYENTGDSNLEVIVVDNASHDGCKEIVLNKHPGATYVQSEENLGFAGGNNLGFHHSSGDVLLFLNPDTEVIGAAVTTMFLALRSMEDGGIVGGRILNPDRSLQTTCLQPYPTLLNQSIDNDYFKRLFPRWKIWGIEPLFSRKEGPVEVEAVSGACIMVRRDVFEQIGLFSSDYFMYVEDIDLCYKARKAGWKVCYIDKAEIIHYGGQSTSKRNENWFSAIIQRESAERYFVKTRGRLYARLYKLMSAITALIRLSLLVLFYPFVRKTDKRNRLRYSFTKWKKILSWSTGMGMERWAEKHFLRNA